MRSFRLLFVLCTALFLCTQTGFTDQGTSKEVLKRSIYLKLPLKQPEYHWIFNDRKTFLSGSLKLFVTRGINTQEIIIFENGHIGEGWEPLSDQKDKNENKIYFGFVSKQNYEVNESDDVKIVLSVLKDIPGIGYDQEGILKEGLYTSNNGRFKIYDDGKQAFLCGDDWKDKWELTITSSKGWGNKKNMPEAKLRTETYEIDDPYLGKARLKMTFRGYEYILMTVTRPGATTRIYCLNGDPKYIEFDENGDGSFESFMIAGNTKEEFEYFIRSADGTVEPASKEKYRQLNQKTRNGIESIIQALKESQNIK
jgi:hypothetical protein